MWMAMKGWVVFALLMGTLGLGPGCIERRLQVNTSPQGARVILNDEQIGLSPVTTTFLWYGDYTVRITKLGYQTLMTHRALKAPWYDTFPFDFVIQVLWPGRIVDTYEWTFDLKPQIPINREDLILQGQALKNQLDVNDP